MNTDVTMYTEGGEITCIADLTEGTLAYYTHIGQKMLIGVQANPNTQYVANDQLCDFTPEEVTAKASLPYGWAWKMPERVAYDPRDEAQRAADGAAATLAARRAAYPPLTDLADALYWQGQGDNSKMDAYQAAVAAVKVKFPKAN